MQAYVAVLPVVTPTGTKTTNKVGRIGLISVLRIVAFQFSGYFYNVVSRF